MTATIEIKTDLASQVGQHMVSTWPTESLGNWQTAADSRDGTAVVVWRTGDSGSVQPTVRGMMLYRWLCSLRDAGFTAEARTDMGVFGRPGEESPVAWWLHVTGWSEPAPMVPPVVRHALPAGSHRVSALPSDPQLPGLGRPSNYKFTYWAPGTFSRPVTYALEYEPQGSAAGLTIPVPDWLAELAEEHRPCLKGQNRAWGCER